MNNICLEQVFNKPSMIEAFNECRKGTYWKNSVVDFDNFLDYKILDILDAIYGGYYSFDPLFHTVINERGKERMISSLTVKDRLVQKCINQYCILPIFRPKFIYNNCASLKDRGIHFALNRLKVGLQKAYDKYGNNFYIAKLDIKSYFDNIPHNYIYNIFDRYIIDKRILELIGKILIGYQVDPCIHDGEYAPFGIGLGGEVPQSMGIICLNELDHLLQETTAIDVAIRYMDDIILIHPDKYYLEYLLEEVERYLNSICLRLNMNKSKIYHSSEGVIFLKFHFYLGLNNKEIYIVPSKKNIKRERRKLYKLYDLYIDRDAGRLSIDDIRQSYMSWRGFNSKVNSYEITNMFDQLYNELFSEETINISFFNGLKNNGCFVE